MMSIPAMTSTNKAISTPRTKTVKEYIAHIMRGANTMLVLLDR